MICRKKFMRQAEYNEKNIAIVESFFEDDDFRKHIESELGLPIKVSIMWDDGLVILSGSKLKKSLAIQDILDGFNRVGEFGVQ